MKNEAWRRATGMYQWNAKHVAEAVFTEVTFIVLTDHWYRDFRFPYSMRNAHKHHIKSNNFNEIVFEMRAAFDELQQNEITTHTKVPIKCMKPKKKKNREELKENRI